MRKMINLDFDKILSEKSKFADTLFIALKPSDVRFSTHYTLSIFSSFIFKFQIFSFKVFYNFFSDCFIDFNFMT